METSKGLCFKKMDLHIHTPSSECFENKNVTPDQIVQKAIDSGLNCIAITDHNTGEWVDKVKKAAEQTSLVVFPGVEITVQNKHLVAIFDPSQNEEKINKLLTLAKVGEPFGSPQSYTSEDPDTVIEIISNEGGLAILAHADSTGGIVKSGGKWAQGVVRNEKLVALEVTNPQKTPQLLDPKTGYGKKAWYMVSDNLNPDKPGNHCLEGIGSRYTYFKVDDEINLESLRQCFTDPETRIRQHYEFKENIFPFIRSVHIDSGFLTEINAEFHEGLNSILGAKGTGKSLLIEFIRFALDQQPTQTDIRQDHDIKLSEKLGQYGNVTVIVQDETGKQFTIKRTYDPTEDDPIICTDAASGERIDVNIPQLFPALFLSQNEIIKIAENEDEQVKFIDKFFDFHGYKNQIANIERELNSLDSDFAELLKAYHEEKILSKQLKTANLELERLKKQLKHPIFAEFAKLETKFKTFNMHSDFIDRIKRHITSFKSIIQREELPAVSETLGQDPGIKRVQDICSDLKKKLIEAMDSNMDLADESLIKHQKEVESWSPSYDKKKEEYQNEVKKLGGDFQKLEETRKAKVKEIEKIEKAITNLRGKVNRIPDTNKLRNDKLDELEAVYSQYSKARVERCRFFQSHSKGKLQIRMEESTNRDEFKRSLLSLKRGSYLRDVEIDQICSKILPRQFIFEILRYDILRQDTPEKAAQHIKNIADQAEFPLEKIKSLADYLLNSKSYEELLVLQYKAIPKDTPDIKYNIGDWGAEEFVRVKNLSTGQKCTTMLILALSQGKMPIVIDQPEDSLDIRAIWDDMCAKIRHGKEERQFIFTTHNSSVAVASDTDKFMILEASSSKGEIVLSGAIDNELIKDEVLKYLEGGVSTYGLKYRKYDISKRI